MIDFSRIPTVTKYLLIINIAFFVLQNMFPAIDQNLALHFFKSPDFQPYQIITHMFMHGSFTHLLFNMYALFMFGQAIEMRLGDKKFLTYYVLTGFGAVILHTAVQYLEMSDIMTELEKAFTSNQINFSKYTTYYNRIFPRMVGASGALFGILAAYAFFYPNQEMYIMFVPVPIKSKYLLGAYAAYELYRGVQNASGDNIAHFAHLGGALFGFIILREWRKKHII
jgi:membrane associated rhomboid family serine protease